MEQKEYFKHERHLKPGIFLAVAKCNMYSAIVWLSAYNIYICFLIFTNIEQEVDNRAGRFLSSIFTLF